MRSGLFGLMMLLLSGSALASQCQPLLHNDITTDRGNVLLRLNGETFTISSQGNLKFGVHKVALRDEQKQLLADYHQMLFTDLPYMRGALRHELSEVVRKVDATVIEELGEQAAVRKQLYDFYQQADVSLVNALGTRQPALRHKLLLTMHDELAENVQTLVKSIGVGGMAELAMLPRQSGEDRLSSTMTRIESFQSTMQNVINAQQPQVDELTSQFCQRLSRWQAQEVAIQSSIPALKNWQTVTMQ